MKMIQPWQHNPRRIYKPGELIYRNAPGAPLPTGAYTLTVGSNPAASRFGYEDAWSIPGAIAPAEAQALLDDLTFYASNDAAPGRIELDKLDELKIAGTWDQFWITFTDYPNGPVGPVPWSAGFLGYRSGNIFPELNDWIGARVGQDLEFTITETEPVTLVAPVVSAVTTRKKRKRRTKK